MNPIENKQEVKKVVMNKPGKTSWWRWIPTLYFAEGLPNVLVTVLSVTMYMQMGMSDTDIALYTSWLQLPWIIKWLWSPFVDLVKTKRWWVLTMQLLLGASLAGVAFTLNTPLWFSGTMFFFFLMAFFSATHDIAADGFYMLELDAHDQSMFVGVRNVFYRVAVIFGQSVLVAFAGVLQHVLGMDKAFSWSLIFYGLTGLFILIWLYHTRALPYPAADKRDLRKASDVWQGLLQMLRSFVTKMPLRQFVFAMLFILLYRFPEAMLGKMTTTFLQRPLSEGGLGLTLEQFGLAYGTIGLIGILLGGMVGGFLAARDGLKRWLWPFVLCLTLPDLVYVYMSYALPQSIWIISACLFIEQFGYGLGFTALTLYMLYYCQGNFKTSHYAICTAISYLGLMLPGMASGWLKDELGYQHFFIAVMFFCVITFVVTAFVKIDPKFGKKNAG